MNDHPAPPSGKQQNSVPGCVAAMEPHPDHGEESCKGSGRLAGKIALVTDSGVGCAVAVVPQGPACC